MGQIGLFENQYAKKNNKNSQDHIAEQILGNSTVCLFLVKLSNDPKII